MNRHNNIIWYFLVIGSLFLLIFPVSSVVCDSKLEVEPTSFTVDLVGGNTVTKDVMIKWTGKHNMYCSVTTDIISDCIDGDSEGIDIEYDIDSPFYLVANVDYRFRVSIHAALNIMPCTYIITTNFIHEDKEDYYGEDYNYPPIADVSAGEEYVGYVGVDVIFNGSLSYDPDGSIVKYEWDFGDGENGTGKVTGHSYLNPGIYNVTLMVTDDLGATDICNTTATISKNSPPSNPIINGTKNGIKNVEYEYSVVSFDPNNDTIRYIFDWGDNNKSVTELLPSGIESTEKHTWTKPGVYRVYVYAEDINDAACIASTSITVYIDTLICGDIGYLIDNDSDKRYDTFYSNKTGSITKLGYKDGKYLIDIDSDGIWDYVFWLPDNLDTYSGIEDNKLVIFVGVVCCALFGLMLLILYYRKKKK